MKRKIFSGFTLIELIVVFSIMIVMTAVAVPNYVNYRNTQALKAGARQFLSHLEEIRAISLKNENPTKIVFSKDSNGNLSVYKTYEIVGGVDKLIRTGNLYPAFANSYFEQVDENDRLTFTSAGKVDVDITKTNLNSETILGDEEGDPAITYYLVQITSNRTRQRLVEEIRIYRSGTIKMVEL